MLPKFGSKKTIRVPLSWLLSISVPKKEHRC
jgi:hypothetical protein